MPGAAAGPSATSEEYLLALTLDDEPPPIPTGGPPLGPGERLGERRALNGIPEETIRANPDADEGPGAHSLLDLAGLVPGFGEPADLLNGAIYAVEGDEPNRMRILDLEGRPIAPARSRP